MATRYTYYVKKIPINKGGYDRKGRYWGIGQPLFDWTVYDSEIKDDVDYGQKRAYNRKEVIDWLKSKYPNTKTNPGKLKNGQWIKARAVRISKGKLEILK